MLSITLKLSPKIKRQLEKDLQQLENITEKPREFHLKKALISYLKHANKLMKYYGEKKKSKKEYVIEDLLEHLNLKKVDWNK